MRKPLIFTTVIFITCGMIALAHAVVYEALAAILVTLFFVQMPPYVRYIFVFLTFSFTLATFISMKWNNRTVRAFYIFSAGWTGFAIYLFFAAFVYGILVMVGTSFVYAAWIGLGLLAVAAATGIYGILHGNTIQIRHVDVAISSASAGKTFSWKNRTAIFVSDVHLGQVRGAAFAKKMTEKILSLKPDIVFIGGDLYDGAKVDETAIIEPLRELTKTGGFGVYFVMGNHEEFNVSTTPRYVQAIKNIGIKILDDEMVTIDGLQVIGVDHGSTEKREHFISILERITAGHFDPTLPTILLKHEPRDLDVAAKAGITLQISGHTHYGQIFPVNLVTRLTFKGLDYGLKKCGNMHVYTSSGIGTWGPPLRVGTASEIVVLNFF
jgi:predicted MPP superfamily phosphohydrolase